MPIRPLAIFCAVFCLFLILVGVKTVPAEAHPRPQLWHWYRTSGARCVHRYEGSWSDPAAPYWGGFQMDRAFMRRWAPGRYHVAGTADHWTPAHQVAAVRRAVLGIGHPATGWAPWPNTSRMCGL